MPFNKRPADTFTFLEANMSLDEPLETVENGIGRFYNFGEGRVYPSITTILGRFKSAGLQEWIDSVPDDRREMILRKAARNGTLMHDAIEHYLRGGGPPDSPILRVGFNKIKPLLKRINNILALETPLYSDIYKIAGRVDCIAEFDGVLSIIDFKTSKKPKLEPQIINYFEQECGYREMFEEHSTFKINQIVTIISVDEGIEPQLFVKNPLDYKESLLEKIRMFNEEIFPNNDFSIIPGAI